jgi:3-deoxy-D-manno-octulosonic acid kinase
MTRRIGSSWHPPAGYREAAIGGTLMVARERDFDAFVAALGMGTLHAWAGAQPGAKAMQGRGVAWATTLPGGSEVVVRHSRHGGMLAPLTQDLFLAPTRAPEELAIAERLRAAGVRTPEVVGYAVYSVAGPLCRADVVTARVDGADLPTAWTTMDADRRTAVCDAVGQLIASLSSARARHHDLNARNVLISWEGPAPLAWVIDVDRITFEQATPAIAAANARRLGQSIAKLQATQSIAFDAASWARILDRAGVPAVAAPLSR